MELHERQRYVPYTGGLRCVVLENQVIRISVAADKRSGYLRVSS